MATSSVWKKLTGWLGGTPSAALPIKPDKQPIEPSKAPAPTPSTTRELRAQRREQLFALVREHMIRAGVLSSAYKFKALTLDKSGDHFLVLMDIQADSVPHDPVHLAALETSMQKAARELLQLEVKYVYWRLVGPDIAGAQPLGPAVTEKRHPPRHDFAPTQPMTHDDLDSPNLSETQYAQFR
jgi:hypothetical protein